MLSEVVCEEVLTLHAGLRVYSQLLFVRRKLLCKLFMST